jgi:hypothetical protein
MHRLSIDPYRTNFIDPLRGVAFEMRAKHGMKLKTRRKIVHRGRNIRQPTPIFHILTHVIIALV